MDELARGVQAQTLMRVLGAQDTLSVDHGASVASVVQDGAALAAGILVGDVIVQSDNTLLTDPQSLGLDTEGETIHFMPRTPAVEPCRTSELVGV